MSNELTAAGKLTPECIKDKLTNAAAEFYGKVSELKRNLIEAYTPRLARGLDRVGRQASRVSPPQSASYAFA